MKVEDIKRLISIMDEHNLIEIAYEEEGKKIHLRRPELKSEPAGVTAPAQAATPPAQPSCEGAHHPESKSVVDKSNLVEIKSPLVGTFYAATKPNTPPFAQAGTPVQPDTIVCIIEAMKVMNEIKAEVEGVVEEVRVKSGDSVQFGQVLFVIRKK